jgi:hypothetical protein
VPADIIPLSSNSGKDILKSAISDSVKSNFMDLHKLPTDVAAIDYEVDLLKGIFPSLTAASFILFLILICRIQRRNSANFQLTCDKYLKLKRKLKNLEIECGNFRKGIPVSNLPVPLVCGTGN